MIWLFLFLFSSTQTFAASCDDPAVHIRKGTDDVLDFWLAEAETDLQKAIIALGCSAPVDSDTLARLWLAEGLRQYYAGNPEGAVRAFAAARKANAAVWVTGREVDPAVREAYESSTEPAGNPGKLLLKGLGEGWQIRVDGAPVESPFLVTPGWHLVQAGTFAPVASAARLVYVEPGAEVTVQFELRVRATVSVGETSGSDVASKPVDRAAARALALQNQKNGLLALASAEWTRISHQMQTVAPHAMMVPVESFVKRHGQVRVRIEDHEEAVDVPEVAIAKAWLENYQKYSTTDRCTMDTDCKGDRVCNQGVCVAPSAGVLTQVSPNPYRLNAVASDTQVMRSARQGATVAFVGGAGTLLFGAMSAATTGEMIPALPFGSVALLSTVITAPIAASSANRARHYIRSRGGFVGVPGYAIAGWTLYALAVINGSGLVVMGAADAYVPAGWIVSCTALGVAATGFMAADALSMRRKLAFMKSSSHREPNKVRLSLAPEFGPKVQKLSLVGTF